MILDKNQNIIWDFLEMLSRFENIKKIKILYQNKFIILTNSMYLREITFFPFNEISNE
jgi:hypothetical protein